MDRVRMVRIRDTLHMDRMMVSESILAEVNGKPGIELLRQAEDLRFDAMGNLGRL